MLLAADLECISADFLQLPKAISSNPGPQKATTSTVTSVPGRALQERNENIIPHDAAPSTEKKVEAPQTAARPGAPLAKPNRNFGQGVQPRSNQNESARTYNRSHSSPKYPILT
jgi:hypothetical protein